MLTIGVIQIFGCHIEESLFFVIRDKKLLLYNNIEIVIFKSCQNSCCKNKQPTKKHKSRQVYMSNFCALYIRLYIMQMCKNSHPEPQLYSRKRHQKLQLLVTKSTLFFKTVLYPLKKKKISKQLLLHPYFMYHSYSQSL